MSDQVVLKFGADTSAVGKALRGLSGEINDFRKTAVERFKGVEEGMKWLARANMMMALITQFDALSAKAKELGTWWGAFSAGGVAATQEIGKAEAEAARNQKKWRDARIAQEKEMLAAEKAREALAKSMRDIVFANANDEGKLNILVKERQKLWQKFLETQDDTEAHYKTQQAYLEKEQEIRDHNLATEKKKTEEAVKQRELAKDIENARQKVDDAKQKAGDRSRLTRDELASNETGGRLLNSDKAKEARARQFEAQADAARRRGDSAESERLLGERDKVVLGDPNNKEAIALRNRINAVAKSGNKMRAGEMEKEWQEKFGGIASIKSTEKDGLTEMGKALSAANEQLLELISKQGGLPVKARMGK